MSVRRMVLRPAQRKERSSPYARPKQDTKSSSWLGGLFGWLNPNNPSERHPSPEIYSDGDPSVSLEPKLQSQPTLEPRVWEAAEGGDDREPAHTPTAATHPPPTRPLAANIFPATGLPVPYMPVTHMPDYRRPIIPYAPTVRIREAYESAMASSSNAPNAPNASQNAPQDLPEEELSMDDMPEHSSSFSASDQIAKVAAFLELKQGQPINEMERAGMLACIRQAQEEDVRTGQFRFTPNPNSSRAISPASFNDLARKLIANPNGPYKFDGPRSARNRTRYRSPAFGHTPGSNRIRLDPPTTTPANDAKKRRVGGEQLTGAVPSTQAPPVSAPAPSAPTNSESSSSLIQKPDQGQLETPSRPPSLTINASPDVIGPPSARKSAFSPTAPAVPSPLRQVWADSAEDIESSPPAGTASSVVPPKAAPTRSADVMASLIKDVTPPKKEHAILNPYQTAIPIKMPVVKKATRRSTRSPAPQEEEAAGPKLSTQTIIEATVPKGSKRSRPPSNLAAPRTETENDSRTGAGQKARDAVIHGTRTKSSSTVEEIIEEPRRAAKKQRQGPIAPSTDTVDSGSSAVNGTVVSVNEKNHASNGVTQSTPSLLPVIQSSAALEPITSTTKTGAHTRTAEGAESPEDDLTPSSEASSTIGSSSVQPTAMPQSRGSGGPFGLKSSAPKEPSKLRFSYKPPSSPAVPATPLLEADATSTSDAVTPPPATIPLANSTATPLDVDATPPPVDAVAAPAVIPAVAPFSFPAVAASPPPSAALPVPSVAPPTTNVVIPPPTPAPAPTPVTVSFMPPATITPPPVSAPAALIAFPPTAIPESTKQAQLWRIQDPKAEALKRGLHSLPVYSFTISEFPPIESHAKAQSAAMQKCLDELPNYDLLFSTSTSTPTPTPGKSQGADSAPAGFDWAAAGMKPPPKLAGGTWTCGTCGLTNPASAEEKCTICEAARPPSMGVST